MTPVVTAAIIVYGAGLIFAMAYALDMKATVNYLQDIVADLDRDLAVVEAVNQEREKQTLDDVIAAYSAKPWIGGPIED